MIETKHRRTILLDPWKGKRWSLQL